MQELKTLKKSLPKGESVDTKVFYYGEGCEKCGNSGYIGRTGIYEVLEITPAIRKAITEEKSADYIKSIAIKEGMNTMLQDGISKAGDGITTIEEVLRVMHE